MIRDLLKTQRLYFDGGTGTMLQAQGLKAGEFPETWNLLYPEKITALHNAYLDAGCDIIKTNTFAVNKQKFSNWQELISAGINCAKEAVKGRKNKFIAFDISATGRLMEPLGDLSFDEAVDLFSSSISYAAECGADLILIETMTDSYETKAAVVAAKESCNLPVFVTNAYDENGNLMTGADPCAMVAMLEGLKVDAIGINCSLGPDKMLPVVKKIIENASVPVIVNPNAGLPEVVDGKTVFNINANEFSDYMLEIAKLGASVLGGCCGTTPEFIKETISKTKDIPLPKATDKNLTVISSYTHSVVIGQDPILIGERINPTGKSKFKEALRQNNINYIINEGITQAEKGVQVLDVNVGLPEIDEKQMMQNVVTVLQSVCDLPLQLDSTNPAVLERAMRIYNGKPLINSVNGTSESMEQIFPLVKKYGGTLIALTIDENGIPDSAEQRFEIALNIIERAKEYGIDKKDIVVDPLALTISSNQSSARTTLDTIKLLKANNIKTSLGVSNISFGLPKRQLINSTFFANALECGLDCAIMNPFSEDMMNVYYSFRALNCFDTACADYISYTTEITAESEPTKTNESNNNCDLKSAVIKGIKDMAVNAAKDLIATTPPIDIINNQIIPALDIIGTAFENKKAYLPQLLMSAEAATAAFEVVKEKIPTLEASSNRKVVLATVKGDIHDIGKNIVKVMLQSYGFNVIDLGRDVDPKLVVETAIKENCKLVGLSALMTTTVPAMEETVKLLHQADPSIIAIVGGAVLTQEYADMIKADKYSKDAMETVRFAEQFYS